MFFLISDMALRALQLRVFSFQNIFGVFIVVKVKLSFPIAKTVAGGAVFFRELSFEKVNIIFFVTADAGHGRAKVLNVMLSNHLFGSFGRVTLFAFDLSMFALENISSFFVVIEGLCVDQRAIIISPLVVRVALAAGLGMNSVIALLQLHKMANFFVAFHALGIINSLAGRMTLQTV